MFPPHAVMAERVKVRHAEDAPEVVLILLDLHLVVGLAGGLVPVDIGCLILPPRVLPAGRERILTPLKAAIELFLAVLPALVGMAANAGNIPGNVTDNRLIGTSS